MAVAAGVHTLVIGSNIGSCDDGWTFSAINLPNSVKKQLDKWVEILNRQSSRVLFALTYLIIVPLFWLFFLIRKALSRERDAYRATEWKKKSEVEGVGRKEFFDSMG